MPEVPLQKVLRRRPEIVEGQLRHGLRFRQMAGGVVQDSWGSQGPPVVSKGTSETIGELV